LAKFLSGRRVFDALRGIETGLRSETVLSPSSRPLRAATRDERDARSKGERELFVHEAAGAATGLKADGDGPAPTRGRSNLPGRLTAMAVLIAEVR